MQWLELTVDTLPGTTDDVAQALTAAGFSDLVLEDQQELETFLDQNRAYWDYIDESLQTRLQGLSQIKLYLEDTDTAAMERLKALLEQLRRQPEMGQLQFVVKPLEETNWEESWKDNYPPQEVGEKLVVLPCWLADSYEQKRLPVILDPGLTFGTGAHPSTQMVMEAMEQLLQPGSNCLDFGSGSGILSIAALRLGAASAVGVDIDPKAEDIARENAAYNGFSAPAFTAYTGNVTADRALMQRRKEKHYDTVLVNIVADVIISLAPVLPDFMEQSSTVILSGILDSRLAEVQMALQQAGLAVTSVRAKEDWRCVTARLKKQGE